MTSCSCTRALGRHREHSRRDELDPGARKASRTPGEGPQREENSCERRGNPGAEPGQRGPRQRGRPVPNPLDGGTSSEKAPRVHLNHTCHAVEVSAMRLLFPGLQCRGRVRGAGGLLPRASRRLELRSRHELRRAEGGRPRRFQPMLRQGDSTCKCGERLLTLAQEHATCS